MTSLLVFVAVPHMIWYSLSRDFGRQNPSDKGGMSLLNCFKQLSIRNYSTAHLYNTQLASLVGYCDGQWSNFLYSTASSWVMLHYSTAPINSKFSKFGIFNNTYKQGTKWFIKKIYAIFQKHSNITIGFHLMSMWHDAIRKRRRRLGELWWPPFPKRHIPLMFRINQTIIKLKKVHWLRLFVMGIDNNSCISLMGRNWKGTRWKLDYNLDRTNERGCEIFPKSDKRNATKNTKG